MRLVIDLQGAQSGSRARGIGRYSLSLATSMAKNPGPHQVIIALNGGFVESAEAIRDIFSTFPGTQVTAWYGPGRQGMVNTEDPKRRDAAEQIRAAFLHSLQPDLLLVSSMFEGFGDDAVTAFPSNVVPPSTAGICYDLIPLLRPDHYLNSEIKRDWYYRRLVQMSHFDGLLCISRSSREEAIASLQIDPARAINVLAGVGPQFRPARVDDPPKSAVQLRYGLKPNYILCVGAMETRKNLDGLIRGYALLPPSLRREHQMVATGWNDASQLPGLLSLAGEVGLDDGELRLLTNFVPEEDLPSLYRASALTVCPSLHEGFGLTVAEAMACGAPVICSNTTSLPEVMNHPRSLFDPTDPSSIAACLQATLESKPLRHELGLYGLSRASRFSWTATAKRAWTALEAIAQQASTISPQSTKRKLRLGVVGMVPPDTPMLGQILNELTRWYHVELINSERPVDPAPRANVSLLSMARLEDSPPDRMLYLPPDDPSAALLLLQMLDSYPGIVLTGKHSITKLLRNTKGAEADALYPLLLELYGWGAACAWRDAGAGAHFPIDLALQQRAVAVVEDQDITAGMLRDAIERGYASGPAAALDFCLSGLQQARLSLPDVARAVAVTFQPARTRTLFVDVSKIAEFDGGTGIQRVVRETALQLGHLKTLEARLELVLSVGGGLQLARGFGQRLFGLPNLNLAPAKAIPLEGDVFLGLDFSLHDVGGLADTIRFVRSRGGRAFVVVYDLLPIQLPQYFPIPLQAMFPFWLRTISELADGLLCISRAVADELMTWLETNTPKRSKRLQVGWFHLGANFRAAAPPGTNMERSFQLTTSARPTLLMVGTLEPRKGQADALTAVDQLWKRGIDVGLMLVGRIGWMMQELEQRIINHPENGRRLNWIIDGGDSLVTALYGCCGALLMASEGEGFGLPLVEAARAGLPVIARDLPIFREVCGSHALYFSGGPDAMAQTIQRWLALRGTSSVPDPSGIITITWEQSSRRLAEVILNDDWYTSWTPQKGSQDDE